MMVRNFEKTSVIPTTAISEEDLSVESDENTANVKNCLIDSDVPHEMADQIIADILVDSTNSDCFTKATEIIKNKLARTIEANLTVMPDSKIAVVGLSGSGKSSVVAKISANLGMIPGNKLKLVSLEQLSDDGISQSEYFDNKDFKISS